MGIHNAYALIDMLLSGTLQNCSMRSWARLPPRCMMHPSVRKEDKEELYRNCSG